MNPKLLIIIAFVSISTMLISTTHHIKLDGTGDFSTIQEGINASVDTDTVLVYPGTYFENLNMNEKDITLASLELTSGNPQYIESTILDGQHLATVIEVQNIETNILIQGLTIQNGYGTDFQGTFGGGVFAQLVNIGTLKNCIFRNNYASEGGAICNILSNITLSGLEIYDNSASNGGGLFLWSTNAIFDSINKCNIYNNNAGSGYDIYARETGMTHVIVDTFTILNPDNKFAYFDSESSYYFDINYGWMELESNDLYVSVDGNDSNSGLSWDEPLKNISFASRKIQADENNPRTVYVASGVYSHTTNQQIFPIGMKEHVSIIGQDINNTILINELADHIAFFSNLNDEITFKNFNLINSTQHNAGSILSSAFTELITLENISIEDNSNLNFLIAMYKSKLNFNNINIIDNSAIFHSGLMLTQCSGMVTNSVVNGNSISAHHESALYVFANDDMLIENCKFINNSANNSNSTTIRLANFNATTPLIRMSNCLVANNYNMNNRVLSLFNYDGLTEFNNCTFVDNTASLTAFYTYGNINMNNTILRNDTQYEIYMKDDTNYGYIYDLNLENNDIKDFETSLYNENNVNNVNWNGGNIDEDPEFLLSGDDPYQLTEFSPCIDTGTPDTTGLFLPPWDLFHNERVWDGDCNGVATIDMGCYEYGADPVGVEDPIIEMIDEISLSNYPNPFNPTTTIRYGLPESSKINLQIYNVKGQLIKVLDSGMKEAGYHEVIWNGDDNNSKSIANGIYFYRLVTPNKTISKKMMLLK